MNVSSYNQSDELTCIEDIAKQVFSDENKALCANASGSNSGLSTQSMFNLELEVQSDAVIACKRKEVALSLANILTPSLKSGLMGSSEAKDALIQAHLSAFVNHLTPAHF